jgi:hypothetical protein
MDLAVSGFALDASCQKMGAQMQITLTGLRGVTMTTSIPALATLYQIIFSSSAKLHYGYCMVEIGLCLFHACHTRSAYQHGVQVKTSGSKSMPMNHTKKKSSSYGSPDNQTLTFLTEIYRLSVFAYWQT